jgi:hypothetical protein
MSWWLLVGLAAIGLAVAACEFPRDAIRVFNASSQPVRLIEEFQGTRIELTVLDPGTGDITRAQCVGDLAVLNLDGEELAHRPGPFCQGDPEWVITEEMLAAVWPDAIKVFNASSRRIQLIEVSGGNRIGRGLLEPDTGVTIPEKCVDDLVASSRDPEDYGEDLTSRPGPLCRGDPEWVITDDMLTGGE